MKVKNVSVESVAKAMNAARELVEHLNAMQSGKNSEINPIDDLCEIIAGNIENGMKFEDALGEIDRMVLEKLYFHGHDTSDKLAKVLQKNPNAVRQFLRNRKIKLIDLRNKK